MELKIKIDDVDYIEIIKACFPLLKKEAENSSGMWAMLIKNIDEPSDAAINGMLRFLPESMKNKLIMSMFENNKYRICRKFEEVGRSQGVNFRVSDFTLKLD